MSVALIRDMAGYRTPLSPGEREFSWDPGIATGSLSKKKFSAAGPNFFFKIFKDRGSFFFISGRHAQWQVA
jgi:hypothetical protein